MTECTRCQSPAIAKSWMLNGLKAKCPQLLNYETPPRETILSILDRLQKDVADLPLHQALREAALA
jgi:hypothetical protein